MDPYEATKVVYSRIQKLDPENASKIMGLLLIQDHGEKEMIRLAFGPENLLHSMVVKARQELGISQNTPSSTSLTPSNNTSNNSSNNPNPLSLSRQTSVSSSNTSRFLPNGLKIPTSLSIPTLVSPSSASSPSWGASVFSDFQNPDEIVSSNGGVSNMGFSSCTSSTMNSSAPPFYGSAGSGSGAGGDFIDEIQLQEQLSFLNDGSSAVGPKTRDVYYPGSDLGSGLTHRRSCSVSDINLGSFDDGLGWKPCLYYARGFCKNGANCRFIHGGGLDLDPAAIVGSPGKLEMMEQCHELLRSKSMQHQKLMGSMASASSFPYSKGLNFLAQHQQNDSPRGAAALMMGEEMQQFGRSRLDNARLDSNSASRQIYLTFPADSTFREEDVSNYFSLYGPVQDVRIPYQQKRMFGFVTFVYPDTVKIILAKGNPHFVCDARVLVKPYKEKGKVPDKFRKQQQVERGEFSACNSPTALDSRDPFDLQLGAMMMYDTRYMLWRRKLEEQADLQQALEHQSRRLMGLQLLDVKRNHHHRSLSMGGMPIPSPAHSPNSFFNQTLLASGGSSPDAPEENSPKQPLQSAADDSIERSKEGSTGQDSNSNGNWKESPHSVDDNLPKSLEHNLPDSPFASPTKGIGEYMTPFSSVAACEATNAPVLAADSANSSAKASPLLPPTSTLDMAPFKSCYFQMPRFSPGHGAIGM